MAQKFDFIRCDRETRVLANGIAKTHGLTQPEAIKAALIMFDHKKGGHAHQEMADDVRAIRAKMDRHAGRLSHAEAVRAAAAREDRAPRGRGGFDHSVWKFAELPLDGTIYLTGNLHSGARQAACRFRETRGLDPKTGTFAWNFRIMKGPGAGYTLRRTR